MISFIPTNYPSSPPPPLPHPNYPSPPPPGPINQYNIT